MYGCGYCRYVGWPIPNSYGFGTGRIWLDDVVCLGTESFIGECRNSGWGRHNCRHYEDVAVACLNATNHGRFSQYTVITSFVNLHLLTRIALSP